MTTKSMQQWSYLWESFAAAGLAKVSVNSMALNVDRSSAKVEILASSDAFAVVHSNWESPLRLKGAEKSGSG